MEKVKQIIDSLQKELIEAEKSYLTKDTFFEVLRIFGIRVQELEEPNEFGDTFVVHRLVPEKDLNLGSDKDHLVWVPLILDDPIDKLENVLWVVLNKSEYCSLLLKDEMARLGLELADLERYKKS